MARDPYCSNCGYSLVGQTESSKCPECGRPLVEVLTRDPVIHSRSRRYKSKVVLFGLPLIHVAQGPYGDERIGKAHGIIAIGDVACGWFAFGGVAVGFVALGGVAIGLVALGGASLGLLAAGGLAIGGAALGGGAIGGIGMGGGAIAYVAEGGGAVGYYARGGGALGEHIVSATVQDPEAVRFFERWAWLLGSGPASGADPTFPLWFAGAAFVIAVVFGLLVLLAYLGSQRREPELR